MENVTLLPHLGTACLEVREEMGMMAVANLIAFAERQAAPNLLNCMIISRQRRFIFVHVPKTGGTALALALEARAAKDDILIGDTPKARARAGRWKGVKTAGRVWKHQHAGRCGGAGDAWRKSRHFQTVTLVRNPWDRVVSYYHWLRDAGLCASGGGTGERP